MKTKKFTVLQLLSIVDGRLATSMDDVYNILNHLTNTSLFTHEIPAAMELIEKENPFWYSSLKAEIRTIKIMYNDDFDKIMLAIKRDYNYELEIPQL